MKTITFILLIAVAVSSCAHIPPDETHTREIFDAHGLKVITSFANRKQQTISVLYGNPLAVKSAGSGSNKHVAGEVFKLVTFNQADNTYWYGSYINGAVKSIETLNTKIAPTDNSIVINYIAERGKAPLDANGNTSTIHQRINSILSRRLLVFPQ